MEHAQGLPRGMRRDFGCYRVVRGIGRGGMGQVYEAVHTGLGRRVALKVLRPEVATNGEVHARFLQEAVAAARVRHPHTVEVFDTGVQDGVPYLVMEYLEGETLQDRLAREGRLAPELLAELMLPVLAAVATAHEEGVVHRDLKPANIFLARGRHGVQCPKVLDFGVSRLLAAGGARITRTHAVLGTQRYMAPEQVRGARHADARSDQYSLGVVLYVAATGARPFPGKGYEPWLAILEGRYEAPRRVCPELPARLEWIIQRAMRRVPEARFGSLHALARELLPFGGRAAQGIWRPVFDEARDDFEAPTRWRMPALRKAS